MSSSVSVESYERANSLTKLLFPEDDLFPLSQKLKRQSTLDVNDNSQFTKRLRFSQDFQTSSFANFKNDSGFYQLCMGLQLYSPMFIPLSQRSLMSPYECSAEQPCIHNPDPLYFQNSLTTTDSLNRIVPSSNNTFQQPKETKRTKRLLLDPGNAYLDGKLKVTRKHKLRMKKRAFSHFLTL